ncbi:MAG TPA: hypothetical protein VFB96_17665 [Pirellulaceae bacterium]|nr:hypothetical protein [Pirellulaceae bacterium]
MKSWQYSLRTVMLALLIALLVLGWWADHVYQSRKCEALLRSNEVLLGTCRLDNAIERAAAATTSESFAEASFEAVSALRDIDRQSGAGDIGISTYVNALKVKQSFNVDHWISGEARFALTGVGPNAVPLLIGLLYDDDPAVRRHAMDGLDEFFRADRDGYRLNVELARKLQTGFSKGDNSDVSAWVSQVLEKQRK